MEIEIDRFDITRSNTLKKYSMIAPPEGKMSDQIDVGVDAVCMLCLGRYKHCSNEIGVYPKLNKSIRLQFSVTHII